MKKILDIPYYSEFGNIAGSKKHIETFRRRSCGIVSVKMVIDYISKTNERPLINLDVLIDSALKHHSYMKGIGWTHSGIIRTLNDFGFISWRKRCFMLPADLKHLRNHGMSSSAIKKYKNQAINEFLFTISVSIDHNFPVLISIGKNLGKKISPHLVVITGYERKGEGVIGLYINDPNNPKNGGVKRPEHKNLFIPKSDFIKIWRKTAIFVEI